MTAIKKISTFKIILFFVFILCCFIEFKFTFPRHEYLFVPRVIIIILFGIYYLISVKKKQYNRFLIAFLSFDVLTSIFFSLDPKNILGVISFNFARLCLILLLFSFKDKLDKKHFIPVTSLFVISLSVILYIIYKNTLFFYLSATATLLLALILSLSFITLLSHDEAKGNLEFFLAACVFLITDTLFSSQRVIGINEPNIFITSSMYYLAFFLIVRSTIKKSKELK